MGDLPRESILTSSTLIPCGLSIKDPFTSEMHLGQEKKFFLAIFNWFIIKAVHIDPVESLSKTDCLAAQKWLTARRCMPEEINSDKSTSFIETKGELEFR